MNKIKDILFGMGAIGMIAFSLLIIPAMIVAFGFCWEFSIDTWLAWAGSPKDFPLWGGCLMAICPGLGKLALPLAVITFVLTFFI